MIKMLSLTNFKAFGCETNIELAPITLIFGENSAGKSSILQALTLLKQTHESRETGAPLLPRAEDGIVDLGSFTELLFDHDVERVLKLGLAAQVNEQGYVSYLGNLFKSNSSGINLGLTLSYCRNERTSEVALSDLDVNLPNPGQRFASFGVRALEKTEFRKFTRYAWAPVHRRRIRQAKLIAGDCNWVTDAPTIWEPVFKSWHNKRDKIAEALTKNRKAMLEDSRQGSLFDYEDFGSSVSDMTAAWENAISFYSSDFSYEGFVRRMISGYMKTQIALEGFLPYPTRPSSGYLPEFATVDSRRPGAGRIKVPTIDIADAAFSAARVVEEALESLFPMGPFRRPPERWYIFTGTSPADVGYRGDHLPDLLFRRPELVVRANDWLHKLEIGYKLRVSQIGERYSDLFEVRLVDTRREREVDVALSDVGFGISQILPFIVQALGSQNRTISIEQPEVHIHPRLQADLGNLIAETIKEPYSHQFLIETHSEHLILRLQRLVREKEISPHSIAVVFVSRGPNGSTAERLHLDERGDFINDWPGGFFPERLRELR